MLVQSIGPHPSGIGGGVFCLYEKCCECIALGKLCIDSLTIALCNA